MVAAAASLKSSVLLRFLVAGGCGYLVNQAALFSGYEYGLSFLRERQPLGMPFDAALLVASLVAMELSILVRFAVNDQWTFRARRDRPLWQRLYQSNLSSLGSPVIAFAAVNLLTPALGVSYLIANSFGILLGLSWNWFWSSKVIWRSEVAPSVIK